MSYSQHEWEVAYTVPVYVKVNVATGEIERVVVYDEGLGEPEDIYRYEGKDRIEPTPVELRQIEAALNNPEADWPGWEFGF